jgi:hypothetical protein
LGILGFEVGGDINIKMTMAITTARMLKIAGLG